MIFHVVDKDQGPPIPILGSRAILGTAPTFFMVSPYSRIAPIYDLYCRRAFFPARPGCFREACAALQHPSPSLSAPAVFRISGWILS